MDLLGLKMNLILKFFIFYFFIYFIKVSISGIGKKLHILKNHPPIYLCMRDICAIIFLYKLIMTFCKHVIIYSYMELYEYIIYLYAMPYARFQTEILYVLPEHFLILSALVNVHATWTT